LRAQALAIRAEIVIKDVGVLDAGDRRGEGGVLAVEVAGLNIQVLEEGAVVAGRLETET
jgi:hypothetical protein